MLGLYREAQGHWEKVALILFSSFVSLSDLLKNLLKTLVLVGRWLTEGLSVSFIGHWPVISISLSLGQHLPKAFVKQLM